MQIGSFVKQQRKKLGLTQQELADKAAVGLNFVYQLEKNKASVQLDKTNQVLKSLGYEIGALRRYDPWNDDTTNPALAL
jgi:y4mF family transcriptional regulator